MTKRDIPMPDRKKLEAALAKEGQNPTVEDMAEVIEGARWALHALHPDADFVGMCSQNPITQVQFRAGLLAMREFLARVADHNGGMLPAADVRATWFPVLGDDPGFPRRFDFDEIAEETTGDDGQPKWKSKPIGASHEALPRADAFLTLVKSNG